MDFDFIKGSREGGGGESMRDRDRQGEKKKE